MRGLESRQRARRVRITGVAAAGALALGAAAFGSSTATALVPSTAEVSGWPRQFGTNTDDVASAVAVSGSGDVFVAGYTAGTIEEGGGGTGLDVYLVRLDKYGKEVWRTQFGSGGDDRVSGITLAGNSLYLVGASQGNIGDGYDVTHGIDAFVTRLNLNGSSAPTRVWTKMFGTTELDYANGVAVAGSDIYIAGNTEGDLSGTSVASHGVDGFVARMKTDGSHAVTWLDQWSTTELDQANAVVILGNDVYVGGSTAGVLEAGAATAQDNQAVVARYSRSLVRKGVKQFGTTATDVGTGLAATGNDVYLTGYTEGTLAPGGGSARDVFLARYDKNLNQKSLAQLGTGLAEALNPWGPKVAVRGSNVFLISDTAGAFDGFEFEGGESDGFLARFSRTGTKTWVRQFGTGSADVVNAIAIRTKDDHSGAVVVVGDTVGTVWGQLKAGTTDTDAFVATFPSAQGTNPTPAVGWPYQFGTVSSNEGLGVAYAPNGDIIVGGHTSGSMSPIATEANKGGYDAFVTAMDKLGRRRWVHQFGSNEDDYITAVAVARNGDVYVGGRSYGPLPGFATANSGAYDGFVRKYDKNGRLKWTYQVRSADGSKGDYVNGVAVARNGEVYAVGYTEGALTGTNTDGFDDGFILKLGSNGRKKWIREFAPQTGSGTVWVMDVAVASNGDPYIVGNVDAQLASDPYLGRADAFIARYNSGGTRIWARQLGGSDYDDLNSVTIAPNGSIYAGGQTQSVIAGTDVVSNPYSDVYVTRYDKNGNRIWLRQVGKSDVYENDIGAVVATNTAVYLAASTQGAFAPFVKQVGDMSAFVGKFATADGASVWVRQYAAADTTFLKDMAIAPNDNNGGGLVLLANLYGAFSTAWGQHTTNHGNVSIARFPR